MWDMLKRHPKRFQREPLTHHRTRGVQPFELYSTIRKEKYPTAAVKL